MVALVFLYALILAACAVDKPREGVSEGPASDGLLWKIEQPGTGEPSYLFGTIHSEDPRVINYPENVRNAFDASKILALEIEFTPESSQYAARQMFLSDGSTLKQLIGEELFLLSVKAFARQGMQEDQVLYLKPWSAFTLLNTPEPKTGVFLDLLLYQQARQTGKTIAGLETIEEQIAAMETMPVDVQIELLRDTLENLDESEKLLVATVETYLGGNLDEIEALTTDFFKDISPEAVRYFTRHLIDQRNQRMAERLRPLMQQGPVFVAVGALHLPGRTGLINLLRQDGNKVTAIH